MFTRSIRSGLLTLGGVSVPRAVETLHLLLTGSTGTGKTTAFEELLGGIVGRGDRAIVCDPNGGYLSQYGGDGDVLLNPFDARSPGWSIFSEMRRDYDAERLACSVVPDGHGEGAAWHHYAQVLLAEVIRALLRRGEASTERLLHWSTVAPAQELGGLLAGTPAAGLFDPDAAKALASTRFIVAAHLTPHRYVRPGDFSLRHWLESSSGSLYLTWRADMQAALAPLIATWVDVLASAVLSLPPDPDRRIWLLVDELAALGKLGSMESALTLGRKHGLAVVAGLQSTAQLDRIYGADSSIILRACFRNLLILGIAKSDPDTCETMSRALGEREVLRAQESRSTGSQGTSRSVNALREQERLVMPSEIANLPNLAGYLALAGDAPVVPIRLTPQRRARPVAPYLEQPLC
ncbi:type IV secretion system DNA-binding domain-containing protein [Paraburkholderia nemoris]|uniref:type IV secretion system DNA-binding domain-containing protein n=1 Tax=Paraburkholderia nemoris TaxID=2793076 RepID=UPI0038B9DEAC